MVSNKLKHAYLHTCQPPEILNLETLYFALHPPPSPTFAPTNCLRTLYDVLHELHGIKMSFRHCNEELIFVID